MVKIDNFIMVTTNHLFELFNRNMLMFNFSNSNNTRNIKATHNLIENVLLNEAATRE